MTDAVRAYAITQQPGPTDETLIVVWTGLDGDDTGSPIRFPTYNIRSVAFTGTFDSGTVVMQGSNDGTNWFTLQDWEGAAVSATSAAFRGISPHELTAYTRPSVSGGGGSCSIVTTLLLSR